MGRHVLASFVVSGAAALTLAGCTGSPGESARAGSERPTSEPLATSGTVRPAEQNPARRPPRPVVLDYARPRRALLSVPAVGVRDLVVAPYHGWTDDRAGTRIQDGGVAASPHGPRGGAGPGGLGNYQVTAHRTSSTEAFRRLPALRPGDRATVKVGGARFVYEIRRTRTTSFRSARSLAEQRAAVPGRPGAEPTHAFITLSTCATPEDHAAGNYWQDEFHNPEHRIDKIGVLVSSVRG